MSELYKLPSKERRIFFEEASTVTGIPFQIIEKDYWVVWTLERLFSGKLKTHLTFKGGTSLSKVYGLIERFSEDIDVSIDKNFFGFSGEKDPEKAESKKKQTKAIKELGQACSGFVNNEFLLFLKENIAEILGFSEGWKLFPDSNDRDGQTLQFEYPNISAREDYIPQSIKIEMGARAEHWPVTDSTICSYTKEALKEKVTENGVSIQVLKVERTFWEKATILHQYAHLPNEKKLPPRLSRHYYDFYCLLNSDLMKNSLKDYSLLERVAIHKSIYFSAGWASYETARKGTLKLLPTKKILKELEEDYKMMEQMFFGKIPSWHMILNKIEMFEREFNL